MIIIKFTPKPEFLKLHQITGKQRNGFVRLVYAIVFEVFSPNGGPYDVNMDTTGELTVTVKGVYPFGSDKSDTPGLPGIGMLDLYTQQISDKMRTSGLNELFSLKTIGSKSEPFDVLVSPNNQFTENYHQVLKNEFKLEDENVPSRFCCPITHTIIGDPAYLPSNPKVNYEYNAIIEWLRKEGKDPTTRKPILVPGVIRNPKLKNEITNFFVDHFLNRNLEKYFTPTKDKCVGTETETKQTVIETETKTQVAQKEVSSQQVFQHSNLFKPVGTQSDQKDEAIRNLKGVFNTFNLGMELNTLAAKALRRAAAAGDVGAINILFKEFEPVKIINLQDDKSGSKRTALHLAIEKGHLSVIKLLLDNKADTTIADEANKKTANDLMLASSKPEVRELATKNLPAPVL